jgi:rhamnosyltransferase
MAAGQNRVAVLLATFNGIAFIEEQVRSICWQTHQEWHIFVRDDGSTDGTLEFLRSLISAEKLTIVDSALERGGSPARNFFSILKDVNLDDFDFVSFCDQDDIWAPGKLARGIECLNSTNSGGYSCNLIPFDNGAGAAWYLKKNFPEKEMDYLFQGASAGCTYILSRPYAILLQQKVSAILADPPIGFSHDWTIYALCRSFDFRWFQDAQAHIFYRQHSLNAFGAMPNYKGLFKRLTLARSGWYRSNILWLGGLLQGSAAELAVLDKVKRFGFADRWWLVSHRNALRRRSRDALLLAVIAVGGFM